VRVWPSSDENVLVGRKKSPAEKKIESYQKDRRNTYSESNARSRHSIRRRKAWVNRTFRRAGKQELTHAADDLEAAEEELSKVRRRKWRKSPDEPLAVVLPRTRRSVHQDKAVMPNPRVGAEDSDLRKEAARRLNKK
jgi:hypothetical protein